MTVRVGIVGAGKMGISHYAIVNAHPQATVAAVCDTSGYVLSVLEKYTGVATYGSFEKLIDQGKVDAILVATPTSTHFPCAKYALERNLHLFVEKPLTLSPAETRTLSDLARAKKRVNQVGFHNRFIGTFQEARRLARSGALGQVTHIHGSAFGQVVTKEQSSTWRSKKSEGGGCLHDYACHVVDLMNFIAGPPVSVPGARMQTIFSKDVEDAVYAVFSYADGRTGMLETNWSDETYRKMSTTITLYGTQGKLIADRQELKLHLRAGAAFENYVEGWNTRYITELQKPVGFYLRGEEYSAQIDGFVQAIETGNMEHENSFASSLKTDRVLELIAQAAKSELRAVMTRIERLLFGDNQFFGVNHMSEEKARAQLMRFKDNAAIIEVLDSAYDAGIRTFMCTTHDRMVGVCDHMRADPVRYKDFVFYPCMPYAHKYANSVTEVGPLETIKRFSAGSVVGTLWRGAVGALTKDVYELMKLLVDGEMKGFKGLNTPVIFVQNVVTDLLLGMKLHGVFAEFHKYVRERYGAEAGFITMNMPALLEVLESVGIQNPIICSNVNKIDFRMCGGRELYEKTIRERRFRPIAMSVFASGAIPPEEALEYVCKQRRIESIVFGASSRKNIEQTRDLVLKLDAKYATTAP